ncbi:Sodium- and chloride-dependent GABA transporter 2 [Hypsibius exemplaris]|uniref:Transporter n=1 Tax=Hypsibius exemplaris TaxID=2072580 RepID=A0A1W0X9U4_HYPEX|nr:Sodium- and chloride-dependent GABA transporter 2 [Hypsibius exemplaris]
MVKLKKGVKRGSSSSHPPAADQVDMTAWKNNGSTGADGARDYEAGETLAVGKEVEAAAAAPARPQWGSKYEFILSHIGCCIGLGNVWRFPYVCYKNGGGAFFIPYFICLVTAGIPIVFLEIAVGQYFATGGISCWDISPIFRGIGYGTTMMAGWLNVYYIVVLSWGVLYLYYTLAYAGSGSLPWSTCDNDWNTKYCSIPLLKRNNETALLGAELPTSSASPEIVVPKVDPTTEFWERHILKISSGINEVGEVQWQLALTLLMVWTICYFCIWKGVKSSGKVVYFTALFPYVMLIILFFRGVTLPNAWQGIAYYITPNFEKLGEPGVWVGAVTQVFFSYAIALGSLTALGSYNKFDYNCYKHSLALCACDSITSFIAGFVVFSVLGFMAGELGVDVKDVAEEGPGLAFIVYPKAAAQMPLGTLWAALFFVMLLFLGLDSQFVTMEGFFTAIMDIYPRIFRLKYSKEVFIFVMCFVWYLLGLTMITNGGMYVFELFDTYAASGMALLWTAFWECVCIGWFYGADRFYDDIQRMIGYRINPWMKYMWKYAGPIFTMSIMLFAIARSRPLTYNRVYTYPEWAQASGWLLALSSMISVPAYAIYRISRESGSVKERFRQAIRPAIEERPEAIAMKEKEALLKPETTNGGSR